MWQKLFPAVLSAGPVLALIVVTAIWGWTFVVVRDAVLAYPVVPYLALRLLLAALLLSPALVRPGSGVRDGVLPGIALTSAYLSQTLGLQYTTASRAGLLTGLFVVITPLFGVLVLRLRPPRLTIVAAGLAMIGTVLLAQAGGGGRLLGDALELVTAFALSVHIILLARIPRHIDASRVALTQMTVAALLFSGGTIALGGFPAASPSVWAAVAITGALASALAFYVQTFVQQRISSTRTAVILTSEPAFATLFGVLLAGDSFTPIQGLGAAVILLALGAHEILPVLGISRPADVSEACRDAAGNGAESARSCRT